MSFNTPTREQFNEYGNERFLDHHINNAVTGIVGLKTCLKVDYSKEYTELITKEARRIIRLMEVYDEANIN